MDDFSIRSSLNSHDNIHILKDAVVLRKMVEITFLCVLKLYLTYLGLAFSLVLIN